MRVRHIDSFALPELQPYQTMRRQWDHRQQGIFVAEGEKVVRRLIESTLTLVSVLLPQKWFDTLEPLLASRADHPEVFIAEKKLLESLTGFSMYQGLLAVGKVPFPISIPQLLETTSSPRLFTATEGLSSAENLGGIVRTSAAFGAGGIITSETCASPFLRRAVRSSMGAIFHLPVVESARFLSDVKALRASGVRCIAAHPHANGRTVNQADFADDCCVVFGSEGYGISPDVLAECDDSVEIPMSSHVDSLNVGNAAAVFLWEATRQRRAAG